MTSISKVEYLSLHLQCDIEKDYDIDLKEYLQENCSF